MSTINQAALGNAAGNYGLLGGLGSYLGDSLGNYLQTGMSSGNWGKGNIIGAFGDKGATYAGGAGSLTGFDSGIGAVAGFAGGLLDRSAAHQRTAGKEAALARSVDTVANTVGALGNYNPLATGAGRLAMGAVNKITGGTDGMTKTDALLGSGAVQGTLTGIAAATGPIGWGVAGAYLLASGINAATGKTTTDNAYKSFMDKDKLTDVSSGYTDMDLENEAQQLYNKKYGGFSRGAYKKAQKKIDQAQMLMTDKIDIRDTAKLGQIRAGMVDANNLRYQMSINGGYKPMAIGREGLKITPERLKEAKEIAKCIRKKRSAKFNVIPAEAREAMRDVTKVPNDAVPFFLEGGQMNVIPEGALHARKHHMEDDEHITKKGIPVVDVNGVQQAEIERNEIIFRKEVTNKLEELAKDGSDEAAIEAGRLLAEEIIENTEDRTGLIEQVTGESPKSPEEKALENHEVIPKGADGMQFLNGIQISNLGVGTPNFAGSESPTNVNFQLTGKAKEALDAYNAKNAKKAMKKQAVGLLGSNLLTGLSKGIDTYNEVKAELKKQELLLKKQLEKQLQENVEKSWDLSNNLGNKVDINTDENGKAVVTSQPIEEPKLPEPTLKFYDGLISALEKKSEDNPNGTPAGSEVTNGNSFLKGIADTALNIVKAKSAQEGTKLPEFNTFFDLKNYLNETGRDSDEDYDLEAAYNDPEVYRYWREEELKNPGKGHWSDKYKKDSHITYSIESVLGDNPKLNGGRWVNADGKDIFIVSPYLENKHSLWDYLDYFTNNEPDVSFRYKGVTYSTGRKKK